MSFPRIVSTLPAPAAPGEIVYLRADGGGAIVYLALRQNSDYELAWFRVSSKPEPEETAHVRTE